MKDSKEQITFPLENVKHRLYIALGLSAWVNRNDEFSMGQCLCFSYFKGDRMWSFAVGIYFISLNPDNLLGVAINGIVLNLAVILFGTAIGDWIDRNPRKSGNDHILVSIDNNYALLLLLFSYSNTKNFIHSKYICCYHGSVSCHCSV